MSAGAVSDLVGLKVRLDRPGDRDRPCCRNLCVITAAADPTHAAALECVDCGQRRGHISRTTTAWIEHVVTRFGAPTIPIVVRKSHTYEEVPAESNL
jgi:hypothetical protein